MDYIGGYEIREPNYLLRFAFVAIVGVTMSAAVFFWRSQLYLNSEYQDMPVSGQMVKIKHENEFRRKLIQNDEQQQVDDNLNN